MEGFWYLIKVLPGKERQLEEQFNTEIGLGKLPTVKKFVCPMEKQLKVIKNKKVIRERVIYTGYLYFQTDHQLDIDELKYLSHLPNIMSILGDKKPVRLREREIQSVLNKKSDDVLNTQVDYKVGDAIKVIDGPFNTFEGEVALIDVNRIDVNVRIFGRDIRVSLTKEQIEKL